MSTEPTHRLSELQRLLADAPAAALRAHQDTVDDEGPAARAAAEAARASIRRQLNLN